MRSLVRSLSFSIALLIGYSHFSYSQRSPEPASGKAIGAIREINGLTITLAPDSGANLSVSLDPAIQILRVAPGDKTLANATVSTIQDLQVGDRIRVTGRLSADGGSMVASKIIAIKRTDLDARHHDELQDWQKRGVDGVASAIDSDAGSVTITVKNKPVVIRASSTTVIRRYPPDSIKFDEAKVGTLKEIRVGDQVRARGDRDSESSQVTAEEIVSGTFRTVAGTVNSIDSDSSSLSVRDLLTRKTVTVKVSVDSQLHRLTPEIAQRLAARLKNSATASISGNAPATSTRSNASDQRRDLPARPSNDVWNQGASGANSPRATPDLQQSLSQLPPLTLADLHKGDAVVIVATEGISGTGTAVTLLSGVEPILQAAPTASSYAMLSPWTLGAPGGDSSGP